MIEQEKLKQIMLFWSKYYDQLDKWIGLKIIDNLFNSSIPQKEISIQFDLLRNAAIKKYISSTHTWIKNTEHQNKCNVICYPFECKVCGQAASKYEEIWSYCEETKDIPSRDMHNHRIYRTCQEILAAKKIILSSRKGRKCLQCNTYGCFE